MLQRRARLCERRHRQGTFSSALSFMLPAGLLAGALQVAHDVSISIARALAVKIGYKGTYCKDEVKVIKLFNETFKSLLPEGTPSIE